MPNPTDTLSYTGPQRAKPTPVADGGVPQKARGGSYGEGYVLSLMPSRQLLADEGSSFVFTTPTPGTGIAYGSAGTQATFSDTVPFIQVVNVAALGGPSVYLDYLKILQFGGTAPATTTSVQMAAKIDTVVRTSTAGTPTSTSPVNVKSASGAQSVARIVTYAGAVATIPAASTAARLVFREQLKGGPTLVLDEYCVSFGSDCPPPQGGYLTTVASYWTRAPEIVVDPQHSCTFHLWLPGGATNPFTYEAELKLFER